ncbi:MAG: hypothetical protein IRZ28_20825 [Steroidobacteraceae bacterium]|nr:hypothetical protein [Steroidobacteraceae bacterium]
MTTTREIPEEASAGAPTGRYRVVCYRLSRSVESLTTYHGRFADALDEAVRRTSPQPSMRTRHNRRAPEATGTMIFDWWGEDEPYRVDAAPQWFNAAVAAGGAFPWGADLPKREVSKLLRAGAR